MRRMAIVPAVVFGVCGAYVAAHWALIELGREVRFVGPDDETMKAVRFERLDP